MEGRNGSSLGGSGPYVPENAGKSPLQNRGKVPAGTAEDYPSHPRKEAS